MQIMGNPCLYFIYIGGDRMFNTKEKKMYVCVGTKLGEIDDEL